MRCPDVDAIIDDHRTASLGAADRAALDAHMSGCARCSAAWLTNEALAGERLAAAPAGLLETVTRRALVAPGGMRAARRVPTWPMTLGLAAAGLAAVLLVAALFALTPPATPPAQHAAASAPPESSRPLVEGVDYRRLGTRTRALPDLGPREVEVVQLFAYDCLPCYSLERRRLERHMLADDRIVLVRVPVQWNERLERYARAYYAAETLGKVQQLDLALYDTIQHAGDATVSTDVLADVFARFGVGRLDFDLAFDSAEARGSVKRAAALAEAYGVTAVPTFVVDGELATTGAAKSYDELLDVVERLVECVERKQDGER
ncbi:MAG TPA: thiol:disulfide interchange protein DsbA/DsbL, partial [Gammaproteobacteria bacterium]|nr:thiol:disulfide interchange protein DsbA/DsbL [Gammaproteobacteria bacterium]